MKQKKLYTTLAITLLLSLSLVSAMEVIKKDKTPSEMTIVEVVLIEDEEFDVLQAAVISAELVEALSTNKQLTVFAPTDEAFIKALQATDEADAIAKVQSMSKEDLTNILLYHVIDGRRQAKAVMAAPRYETLSGETLTRNEVLPNIIVTDYSAKNGLIHILEDVLMPNN